MKEVMAAMANETKLTLAGLKELQDELENLKTVGRKEMAEKIKVALSFGDLSENSEYDEAKSEQGKLEARINELETMLNNVVLIDEDDSNTGIVRTGLTVKVKDQDMGEIMTFRIVGPAQADPDKGYISEESPVGKALIGHAQGETVMVEAPAGNLPFEILEITK